jgi:hypothetical protein
MAVIVLIKMTYSLQRVCKLVSFSITTVNVKFLEERLLDDLDNQNSRRNSLFTCLFVFRVALIVVAVLIPFLYHQNVANDTFKERSVVKQWIVCRWT